MASTLIVDQIQKTGGSTTALTLPTSNASASQYLQNDGAGDYIKTWNVSGVAKPSASQLNAFSSDASKLDTNNGVRDTRKKSYGEIGDQLDLLYKDIIAGKVDATGEWAKKIKAVKDANPKS